VSVDFGFSASCKECIALLHDSRMTHGGNEHFSSISTVMRQFDSTQHDMGLFVDELQIRGIDLSSIDIVTGMSALHYAVRSGAANVGNDEQATKIVAQLLTQPGVDVNGRCKYAEMPPLHYAALYNCPLVIRELAKTKPFKGVTIQAPCDLNAAMYDDHGGTAYHHAVIAGHPEVVQALLDVGADHTIVNDHNYTPLMCAQEHYDRGATDNDLATDEELRIIIELLKDVENKIPAGRWVDLQGHFCEGAIVEIYRDGSGVNESTTKS
jgi:hypothetical protein